jgi:hypothetical protein
VETVENVIEELKVLSPRMLSLYNTKPGVGSLDGDHKTAYLRIMRILEELCNKVEIVDEEKTSYSKAKELLIILKGPFSQKSSVEDVFSDNANVVLAAESILEIVPFLIPKPELRPQTELQLVNESRSTLDRAISDAKSLNDELRINNENAKELNQILSGKVLNGYYEQRASGEREKASNWTKGTWFFATSTLFCLLALLLYQIGGLKADTEQAKLIDLQFLGTKFLIITTLGLIAKWTSKRANRHLMEEAKYHRLAVNIATVKPFTDILEPQERSRVLAEIAIKIFTDGTGNESSSEFDAGSFDILKSLLPKGDK